MAAADYTQVAQQIYLAYFGRPADHYGLLDMTAALAASGAPTDIQGFEAASKTNVTIKAILENFGNSDESKALYGTGGDAAFINAIYTNVLGREADVTGLDFWVAALKSGAITRANAAVQIISAASKPDADPADLLTVTNKVAVATTFTQNLDETSEIVGYSGDVAAAQARELLATVNGTTAPDSFAAAIDATITTIANPPVPALTISLTAAVDSGTAFTGARGDDVFNADLTTAGNNTLNSLDRLNGGAGNDTLNVVLASDVTPAQLTNIETISVTAADNATLGLANATGVTSVINSASSNALLVTGINAGAKLYVTGTAANTQFDYATPTGSESVSLGVDNVTDAASITINGVDKITTTATGSASSYILHADSVSTLAFAGSAAQTVVAETTTVTKYDASAATAGVTLTTKDQTGIVNPATVVSVLGGSGNDVLTLVESNNLSVDAGAGNDTVVVLGLANADTVAGGAGTDTLKINSADAITLAGVTTTHVSGFEKLTIADAFDGSLTVAGIDAGINTVTLGLTGASLAIGGDTIVGGAGTFTVNLGANRATSNVAGILAGALTLTDTGTAATDSLVLNATATTAGVNENAFGNQNIVSNGYENVTVNTGVNGLGSTQTIGTLTITPDTLASNVSLTLTGANATTITSVTTTSTGKLTIDASAVGAQATGSTITISGTTLGAGGTQVITASAGDDSITVGSFASTIDGGAGNDTISGGNVADSILGGAGNDSIVGGGGNDTISGGAGNDSITVSGGATSVVSVDGGDGNDTVIVGTSLGGTSGTWILSGGAGTDTLSIGAAVAASAAQSVTNFETLSATAALTQDMVQFTSNAGFTKLTNSVAGAVVFNNVGANVTSFSAIAGSTSTVDRLVDSSSNALVASFATGTVAAFTANDEETLTLSGATGGTTLTTLNASDLTTLNITGSAAFTIANAIVGATELATINAAAATGAVTIDGSASTVNTIATGSLTASSVLTTGSGNDSIVGGDAADTLSGGAGADTIVGGNGGDILSGGSGADSLVGGEGADTITGGSGNDIIVLTENTAVIDRIVFQSAANNGVDTITGFTVGTGGDVISLLGTDTTLAGTGSAVLTSSAVTLVASGVSAAIAAGSATNDVIVLTGTLAANGDLSASTNGSELLKLLGTADNAASGLTTAGATDSVFVVAYDNGNAYLYNVTAVGSVADAAHITLVGVINGASGAAGHTVDVANFITA